MTLQTSAAFGVVVSLYEWGSDSKIKKLVGCGPGALSGLTATVRAKHNYTVQIGGVDGAAGPIAFEADYFPDTDRDTKLDPDDKCPTVPGHGRRLPAAAARRPRVALSTRRAAGCASTASRSTACPRARSLSSSARGCGRQTVTARKQGSVKFPKLVGKVVRAGRTVTLKVTLKRTGKQKYKFGAIGSVFEWPVRSDGLGKRVNRCIAVKTGKIVRCSAAAK